MRIRWLSISLSFVFLCGPAAPAPAAGERGLDIYFIDAMGGAATLLVTPERESILIDSGWPGLEDRDPKRIEHVLKDVAGLDHLDHLVTTHWHTDHFGGVEGLAKRVRIDHFWDRGLPDLNAPNGDKANFPDGPAADNALGIAYRKASEGKRKRLDSFKRPVPSGYEPAYDRIPLEGTLKAIVLASGGHAPPPQAEHAPNPLCESCPPDQPVDPSDNARSLALVFRFGKFDFLDCGDLTWNVEKQLVCPHDFIGPIDLYQVTHHGMDISNHPTLVRTIAPTVAIMNNGPRKGGSPATVKLLKETPSIKALYQLHKNAATGPEDNTEPALIANSNPAGGQFIHVTVSPGGEKFSVQIGEDGAKQTFESK